MTPDGSPTTITEGLVMFISIWTWIFLLAGSMCFALFVGETVNYMIDGNCDNTEMFYKCKPIEVRINER